MKRLMILSLFLSLIIFYGNADGKTFYSEGNVDNSSGTPNKDLIYKDFEIGQDGYVTGAIVNISNHLLKSVRLDMWTTNKAETRILWRKTINIGDMPPKGRFEVREVHNPVPDDPSTVVFKFRLPASSGFRNTLKQ